MTNKVDERLRKQLVSLREELLRVLNGHMEEDHFGDVLDEADRATELIDGVMDALVTTNHKETLEKIDEALSKMDRGEYGQCERCGEKIEEKRLNFMPFATFCINCKRLVEEESVGG